MTFFISIYLVAMFSLAKTIKLAISCELKIKLYRAFDIVSEHSYLVQEKSIIPNFETRRVLNLTLNIT